MRRKQSMQHFDQRQLLLLENAYYQVQPVKRYYPSATNGSTSVTHQNVLLARKKKDRL